MKRGQSTIEFTFAVIMILLLTYGMIMVFRWVGLTYAERRYGQEKSLTRGTTAEEQVGAQQADYRTRHLEAVFTGKVYK